MDVLLVHAGVADRRMWEPLRTELEEAGHRLLAPDLRGFGERPLEPGPFSHVDDLVALLDAEGVRRAAVVGASFGGKNALDLALAHPDRVAALVLIGPAVGGWDFSDEVQAFGEQEDALLDAGDVDAAVELNLRTWVDGPERQPNDVDPGVRALVGEMQKRAFELQLDAYAAEPYPEGRALDPPALGRLGEIGAPTLVLVGELDVEDFREQASRVAEEIRGARLEAVGGTAHLPSLERPELVARTIVGFLHEVGA